MVIHKALKGDQYHMFAGGFVLFGWLVGGDWNMTFIFPYIGDVIIPIDELIFFRGDETTKQLCCMMVSVDFSQNPRQQFSCMSYSTAYYFRIFGPKDMLSNSGRGRDSLLSTMVLVIFKMFVSSSCSDPEDEDVATSPF